MTTIGQLNFIRWFIVFNVHAHFKANKHEITRMARQPKASKTYNDEAFENAEQERIERRVQFGTIARHI